MLLKKRWERAKITNRTTTSRLLESTIAFQKNKWNSWNPFKAIRWDGMVLGNGYVDTTNRIVFSFVVYYQLNANTCVEILSIKRIDSVVTNCCLWFGEFAKSSYCRGDKETTRVIHIFVFCSFLTRQQLTMSPLSSNSLVRRDNFIYFFDAISRMSPAIWYLSWRQILFYDSKLV